MPDDRIKISALPSALSLDNTDVLAIVQGMTGDSKATKKAAVTLIAAHLLETMQHNNLDTSDKTIIGAINEVAETLEGLYPVADASGPIANFSTELARPLEALKVGIVATQEAGTPTPASPLPISGWSEVSLVHCGKNLFNGTSVINAYLSGAGVVKTENKTRLVYALCRPNTTFTVSKQAGLRFAVAYCDDVPTNNLQTRGMIISNSASSITITTDSTAKYLVAYVFHSDYDSVSEETILASVQIELGSTATTYEAYNGNTVTIALGDTYNGGYVTQDKDGHRQLVVDKGYKDLSDLSWVYNSGQNAFASTSLISLLGSGSNVLCSRYKTITDLRGSALSTQDYAIGINKAPNTTTGNFQLGAVVVKDSTYTDAVAFTNAVSGSKMIYELATPIVIDLPDGDPLNTLIGVNNIFADSGDILECKYKDTIQHYIDTQIAATQALIL